MVFLRRVEFRVGLAVRKAGGVGAFPCLIEEFAQTGGRHGDVAPAGKARVLRAKQLPKSLLLHAGTSALLSTEGHRFSQMEGEAGSLDGSAPSGISISKVNGSTATPSSKRSRKRVAVRGRPLRPRGERSGSQKWTTPAPTKGLQPMAANAFASGHRREL